MNDPAGPHARCVAWVQHQDIPQQAQWEVVMPHRRAREVQIGSSLSLWRTRIRRYDDATELQAKELKRRQVVDSLSRLPSLTGVPM